MRALAVLAVLAALALALVAAARELRVLQADARTAFYVAIAAPPSAAAAVAAFNRTLSDVSRNYLAGDYPLYLRNITLQPLYIELPEDESLPLSVNTLYLSCSVIPGIHNAYTLRGIIEATLALSIACIISAEAIVRVA